MARILLAEDYEDLRSMIGELLRGQDHYVETHDDGMEAQYSVENKVFDLIVLDWELPHVSGLEICRAHRKAGGTTPILLLTGKKAPSDKQEGFDAGADDYLTKPFHPTELVARIRALLRRAALVPKPLIEPGELEVGSQFTERYEILSTLGRGSTGVIYKARHVFLNRLVALKVLHQQLVADPDSVARFRREAQAVSSLNHENVIAVSDFGINPAGQPYLAMDYAEGQTLLERVQHQDHLSLSEALPIFSQICDGLHHAHTHGVIHRDVKPSNMLLVAGTKGRTIVKIVDFGIAKMPRGGAAMQVTQDGDILGSPSYMSPEQCMGHELDLRTDIFSMGCLMYGCMMGIEPFAGDNVLDTMYRRTVEDPKRFTMMRPDISLPQAIEVAVMKALKRKPEFRYQSMPELKKDLEELRCSILS